MPMVYFDVLPVSPGYRISIGDFTGHKSDDRIADSTGKRGNVDAGMKRLSKKEPKK